jgi:uncharacterized protein YdhG (YjbR/CyaY superfamily)
MKRVKSGRRSSAPKSRGAPKNVDAYVARVPELARGTFNKLRAAIRSVVPREATKTISYGIATFRHGRVLVRFVAFSKHCSLFPTAAVMDALKDNLKGFWTSKGRVHFPTDKTLLPALIRAIMGWRSSMTCTTTRHTNTRTGAPLSCRPCLHWRILAR